MTYAPSPDGTRIAWRLDGPQGAPTLLLCSMATAALSVWEPVLDGLTSAYRVLRYDRRGEGDSDPGPPPSHSLAIYAQDALTVMAAAGAERAVVCGMAFGARVAVRLALDHPQAVSALMLFDATGGPPAQEAVRRAGGREAERLRAEAGIATPAVDRRWFARRDPAGAGLILGALAGEPDWTPGLGRIAVQTLVACGEQDPNLAGARRLAREIPLAVFEPMPMTGHASILDRPDLVGAIMRRFLETCS